MDGAKLGETHGQNLRGTVVSQPPRPWNLFYQIRRLYDWTMQWADHHHNTKFLGAIAAAESIFFPIPPDVLLIAMGASRPPRSLWYAFIATVYSVVGGIGGYLLGYWFWHATQHFFLTYIFSPELFQIVVNKYQENTFWAIFVAAFTPIPFKVFTVAGGVAQISIPVYLASAFFGRGMRFFLVGGLLYYFGAPIRGLIDRHLEKFTVAFTVLLILGFLAIKHFV